MSRIDGSDPGRGIDEPSSRTRSGRGTGEHGGPTDRWWSLLDPPDPGAWLVDANMNWDAEPAGEGGADTQERGTLRVEVADGSAIDCAVRSPRGRRWAPPLVVLPCYRIGWVTGHGDPQRYGSAEAAWRRAFATHLVSRGVTVVAVPWWFESLVTEGTGGLAQRYAPAVAEHRRRHRGTGLGRAVADLVAVVDALDGCQQNPRPGSYGCFGHSLGGKLAMFLSALDGRVRAAVASEPGLGWSHSNWSDPWYLGDRVSPESDQDELLALIPPRRILLVAGGDSDGPHNASLVAAARARVDGSACHPAGSDGSGVEVAGGVIDGPGPIEVFRHAEGHTPSVGVAAAAYDWLTDALGSG